MARAIDIYSIYVYVYIYIYVRIEDTLETRHYILVMASR